MRTNKIKVVERPPPHEHTQQELDEFDKMFNESIDEGYRPGDEDEHTTQRG